LTDVVAGSFSDASSLPASAYQATIDWGDGTPPGNAAQAQTRQVTRQGRTPSTITQLYLINGSHTYAAAGTYPVNITISAADGRVAYLTSLALVGGGNAGEQHSLSGSAAAVPRLPARGAQAPRDDSPAILVHGTALQAQAGTSLTDVVAGSFSDASSLPASAYQATIDWGDGAPPGNAAQAQTRQVTRQGRTPSTITQLYLINGSHTYAAPGTYPVNITITTADGRVAYLTSLVLVGDGNSG
jgi:hypothetical protein